MTYRNLVLNDCIPDSLDGGMPLKLTPELAWVAVDGMKVVGIFLAFAAHGIFQPFRVNIEKGVPNIVFTRLCRKAFSDARARGYEAYVTFIANDTHAQRRLYRILRGMGTVFEWEGDSMVIGGEIESILKHGPRTELKKAG
jgi:hypothetical protein